MHRTLLATLLAALLPAVASGDDWIFRQGYYTHSPTSGGRIAQYTPLPQLEPLPDSAPLAERVDWRLRSSPAGGG